MEAAEIISGDALRRRVSVWLKDVLPFAAPYGAPPHVHMIELFEEELERGGEPSYPTLVSLGCSAYLALITALEAPPGSRTGTYMAMLAVPLEDTSILDSSVPTFASLQGEFGGGRLSTADDPALFVVHRDSARHRTPWTGFQSPIVFPPLDRSGVYVYYRCWRGVGEDEDDYQRHIYAEHYPAELW